MTRTVRERFFAAGGAVFVVLVIIGNVLNTAGATGSDHPTGAQVLRDVARQHANGTAAFGFVLEIVGFVAFFGFLGYLLDVLRRRTPERESIAVGTAVLAGVTMLAVKLGSAAPVVALDLDRHTVTPELAQVLNDMNAAAFVISWLPFAVFVAATADGLRRAGLVGRPTAAAGYVLGAAGALLALLGLHDVLHANPVAFLLALVWLVVISVRRAVQPSVVGAATVSPSHGSRVPTPA
jgi:hypothetical protein